MLRKMISVLVLTLFICSNMGLVFAEAMPDMAVLDKVIVVEKFFDGSEQSGPLVERISKLEKDIWGKENTGSLVSRVDKIYSYCRINFDNAPSFLIKMNAAEWSLTHMVTVQPVKVRIENLERVLLGNATAGPFDDRLNQLLKFAYANGKLVVHNVTVNKDNLLKIKLVTPLNTKVSRTGDVVVFQVADDIYVDGSLIIAKGAQGTGKVSKVEESKNFGRDAQLEISFDSVDAIDGSIIHTILGEKAKAENKSLATAAGASVAGMMILGPVGIVGGAFVHGKDVEIPAGAEVYVQIKEQVTLYGI
ncbi:hypothetical protein [Pelosinus sp. sgz500959]|uniref:hypothetical protein n=1 Tax=Pelosinus sp. sgz500959 TaxID=3242472 RepID=UPI00366D1699